MENEELIKDAYFLIFQIPSEQWELKMVKFLGKSNNLQKGNKYYDYDVILTAPIGFESEVECDDKQMVYLQNQYRASDITGAEVIEKIKYKIVNEDKKVEDKKFVYYCYIKPESVKNFIIMDGTVCITVSGVGVRS